MIQVFKILDGINQIEPDIFFRMAEEYGTSGHKDKKTDSISIQSRRTKVSVANSQDLSSALTDFCEREGLTSVGTGHKSN